MFGSTEITRTLFMSVSISGFFTMYCGTYVDLTLKFLSSLEIPKHASMLLYFIFRLQTVIAD